MTVTIRPMTPADVDLAADALIRGDWGDRRLFLSFAVDHPECDPLVVEADGEIVGTGVGTRSGPAGWVGAIYVTPERRGQGLGTALSHAVSQRLEAAGCRTIVLVATDAGRPIYERLGFRVTSRYHTLDAPAVPPELALAPEPGRGEPGLRPFDRGADLDEVAALDRRATGEDRAHLLRAFASPDTAWILRHGNGPLLGFVVRAPWGGGATVAVDVAAAIQILDGRRRLAGPERRLRAGVLDENAVGRARLLSLGWTEAWSAPRMERGEPLDWQPELLWGQFNHAIG